MSLAKAKAGGSGIGRGGSDGCSTVVLSLALFCGRRSGIRHRNGGDISAPLAQFRTRFTATSASVHHPPRTPFVEHVVTSREEGRGRAASINSHTKALSTEIGDSLELDPHHRDKSANFPPLSRCNERSSVDRPCALSWRHGTSFLSSIPITIIELFFMLPLCLSLFADIIRIPDRNFHLLSPSFSRCCANADRINLPFVRWGTKRAPLRCAP